MVRFYVEGDEIDVQEPNFFIDEDTINQQMEALSEMLDYV